MGGKKLFIPERGDMHNITIDDIRWSQYCSSPLAFHVGSNNFV